MLTELGIGGILVLLILSNLVGIKGGTLYDIFR